MFTRFLSLSLLMLFACVSLSAQSNTGRILGTVTDQTGGAITGAMVIVTNTGTNVARTLTTDQAGEYNAPNLLPGTYSVRATQTGFKTAQQANILIETAKDVRVDLQMVPGDVAQTVEVTTAAPLVDTTSSTLGGTISNETINDLPLNGRNYMNLISLRPGVTTVAGGAAWNQSTNGIRPEDQNYMIDGLNNNEPFSGQGIINSPSTSGDAATILPIDAIQDFNVEENPRAEFGWKPGSVVNVSIKSGTNQIHGTAYAFGRNGAWDANNFFSVKPQAVALEQWGGTAGGHIVKDKLFYFAGFERQTYTVGNATPMVIPLSVSANGATNATSISIPDAQADIAAHASTCSSSKYTCSSSPNPLSLKLEALWPTNPGPGTNLINNFPNANTSNNVVGKIDYHINDKHTLSGSYFFGNDTGNSEDSAVTQQAFDTLIHVRAQALSMHWAWTPSTSWVNEARLGVNRYFRPAQAVDHNVPVTSYGINTGVTNPELQGMPKVNITGFTGFGGSNQQPNFRGPNTDYDVVDQLSYLHGAHAFKFGGELLDGVVKQAVYGDGKGVFNFSGKIAFPGSTPLEDYLVGALKSTQSAVGDPTRYMHQWGYAFFGQDDWRATRKLTLNLGLRWEYDKPPTAKNNLLGNWTPTGGLLQVGQQISSVYRPDHFDFAPRLGMAWDVTGNGTTVVRAGGGIMYEQLSLNAMINASPGDGAGHGITVIPTGALLNGTQGTGLIAASTPSVTSQGTLAGTWNLTGPVLPSGTVACSTASPCGITAMALNFREPYVTTWTLSIQHAFSSTLSAEAAYVGDHGSRLLGVLDVNQLNNQAPMEVTPELCSSTATIPQTHCEFASDRPYFNQYPYLSEIAVLQNLDRSNYNGLQVSLTARSFHNLSFVAGYTYAHASDMGSVNFGALVPENSLNPGAEYGPSNFDVRHHFTFSPTYNIPGKKSPGQILEGWQINGIVALQSGTPWDPIDTGKDYSGTGETRDRWDFFGNPSDFKSSLVAIPFFAGTTNAACATKALAIGSTEGGCYARGSSMMIPAPIGTFGTAGRNMFRSTGYHNVDMSVTKNWKYERLGAQFRAEFFNVFNHPEFAPPSTDPSGSNFGLPTQTPDVAAPNVVLGSGGARAIQLGLKLTF